MTKLHETETMCHRTAAEYLGVSRTEFAAMRGRHEIPEPDNTVIGQQDSWNTQTIYGIKRQRDQLKRDLVRASTMLPAAQFTPVAKPTNSAIRDSLKLSRKE
jgi:hypothetical protein